MGDTALTEAYNAAVDALRRFRDAHLRIVALYIIGPSRRAPPHVHASVAHYQAGPAAEVCGGQGHMGMGVAMKTGSMSTPGPGGMLRGTGGTDLVRFLKGVRDRTSGAAIGRDSAQ
jgi:indoleamine 2,3-dioxygenase